MDADPNATAPSPSNLAVPDPLPADVGPAVHRRNKLLLSLRIDPDVLEWFRKGPRYQTRMNAVLRAYMQHARSDRG